MTTRIKINFVRLFLLFFFTLTFLFNTSTVFASTCNAIGNTTYCSDGTSYSTIGNTTYGSDGTMYSSIGGTTYVNGPNGYSGSASTIGNTTYYNGSQGDNWNASTIGNTTYINGSNGTYGTISNIGNTSYGDGNAFNTCPANSTLNSSTNKCSCNYGYSVNYSKTACVYSGTYNYTAPTTSSCPLNSYSDGAGSCKCNYGYGVSGGACVQITQICQNKYGYASYGSGTSCYCSTGYQWNSSQTSCVLTPTRPTVSSITSPPTTGGSCSSFGTGAGMHGSLCYCSTGYQWNSAINSCVIGYPTFTRYLTIGSTGTEVVNLKNLLAVEGLYTGYVSTAFDNDTATAVSLYQTLHDISATGTVGPLTRAALNESVINGY